MPLERLFEDFGIACGLPRLALDAGGSCSLVFDDEYEVTYTHDEEDRSILLSAPLLPATNSRAPMLRHALETGYLGARTRGGTISIDPERGIYVYWKRHDVAALSSAEALGEATRRFLTELIRIRRTAQDLYDAKASRDDGDPAPSGDLPPDAWLLYV